MSRDYVQEIIGENAKTNKDSSAKLYKKWMNVRLADLNFVLDTIISNVPRYPKDSLYRRIDPQKIGLIGHSLGGAAVLGVGRQRKGVQAVIALEAPFLCDIKGVQNGEFVFDESPYPRPLLNIYSDSSWSHLTEWPQYATNARLLQTVNKDLYNIYLEGTGHLGLTDLSLVSPFWTRILDGRPPKINPQEALMQINGSCLTFLNYVLKRNKSMDLEI